jgi:hypothetical protein
MKVATKLAVALVAIGCGADAPAKPRHAHAPLPTIAVLGLDGDQPAASELTQALRAEAASPRSRFALAPKRERELAEMRELANCANESASCMADIGADLEVDFLIYGHLERGTVKLALMDVAKRFNRRAISVPVAAAAPLYAQLGATNE